MNSAIHHKGEHWPMQIALSAHSKSFALLEREMDDFQPLPLDAFQKQAEMMWAQMRPINPHMSDEDLQHYINEQISSGFSSSWQFVNRFLERYVSERVSIIVLASAFAEALINAILAIGLVSTKKKEVFALLEKATFMEKWVIGPKIFLPNYAFAKDRHLYCNLKNLNKQRNLHIHSKLTLQDTAGLTILNGSGTSSISFAPDERATLRRYLDLPYALHKHVCDQVSESHLQFQLENLLTSNPLESARSSD